MKYKPFLLVFFLPLLFGCQAQNKEIIIDGTILGPLPARVEYTVPVNGSCNWLFTESVIPDSLGNFHISLDADEVLFIKLRASYQQTGTLILKPASSYDVVLDLREMKSNFYVKGQDSLLHAIYKNLPNPPHIQDGAREFFRDSIAQRILDTVGSRRNREVAAFEDLLTAKLINREILDLVRTDRECYYNALLGNIAWIKKLMEIQGATSSFPLEFEQLWKSSYSQPLFKDPDLIHSQWFFAYAENYIYFNDYLTGNFTREKLKELSRSKQMKAYRYKTAGEYLPEGLSEDYLAAYILGECIQKEYEKELIGLYEDFKTDYPGSAYTSYLDPMIEEIVEFHRITEGDYSSDINILDDYQDINSLAKAVSHLPEGLCYVDVWATWCGPCKQEFKYEEALKDLLKEKGIQMLYISIDRDNDSLQWKNMIKYYDLKGYHIRAGEKLNKDLLDVFDEEGSLSIPWNIIMDSKGKILKKHASRPSQLEQLKEELDEVLKIY